jgi:uncharacterized protein
MASLNDILDRYNRLRAYCDAFWSGVFSKFPLEECACSAGCSTCCELSSVNFLEAFTIATYCAETSFTFSQKSTIEQERPARGGPCPFLGNDRCRIYPARPVICRTHGLLLKSDEFSNRISASCPYNFTGVDYPRIDPALALDTDAITDNLARLNAAFCILKGDVARAHERVALRDLAGGTVGPAWFAAGRSGSRTE